MKPESVAVMVDDANITLTSLRMICNCIRDASEKHAILPEEAVHNLRTGYMEAITEHINTRSRRVRKRITLNSGIDRLTVF